MNEYDCFWQAEYENTHVTTAFENTYKSDLIHQFKAGTDKWQYNFELQRYFVSNTNNIKTEYSSSLATTWYDNDDNKS